MRHVSGTILVQDQKKGGRQVDDRLVQQVHDELKAAQTEVEPGYLRGLRARAELSQAAMARLIGVSTSTYANWDCGVSSPSGPNVIRILDVTREIERQLSQGAP